MRSQHSAEVNARRSLHSKQIWSSASPDEREQHVARISEGVKRYCANHREIVLERANDPERCRKISKSLKEQYRKGVRTCTFDALHFKNTKFSGGQFKRGHFYSRKAGAVFFYRSSWEQEVFKFLEAHPAVREFAPESAVCPYEFEGRVRDFIIDLVVDIVDLSVLTIEIKPASQCISPPRKYRNRRVVLQNMAKIRSAREWATRLGVPFILVTDVAAFKDWFNDRYEAVLPRERQSMNIHYQTISAAEASLARIKAKELGLLQ